MIRVAYKVVADSPELMPSIVKVTVDDPEGVSWRDAKKQLRAFYTFKAKELRNVSERDMFPASSEVTP